MEACDRAMAHLTSAVAQCIETGVFRTEAPEQIALALWACAHGAASLLISGGMADVAGLDPMALAETTIAISGLGAALASRLVPEQADKPHDSRPLVAALDALASAIGPNATGNEPDGPRARASR
jgi:hypothetical protein